MPGRDQLDGVLGGRGALERGKAREALPAEGVVEGVQHDVVGEILDAHLVDRGHDVVLGGHDHRGLGVEGDRAEHRTVDRQAYEARVGVAGHEQGARLGGGHLEEGQGVSGRRSFQIRTHLAGITPGTYASRNAGESSEPVTAPGYLPWSALVHTLDTLDTMTTHQTSQTMKPATAAKKLGVYLEATPAEFQEGVVTRAELTALQADPPAWLRDLRRDGPHPRPVVASKLSVSNAGLARGGVTEALTTEQIDALKQDNPEWLQHERSVQAAVRKDAVRIKELQQEKQEKRAQQGK